MAPPTNREEFKAAILRRLGAPVIQVELDDDQLDDRVDFALNKFKDYHFDGSTDIMYAYQITSTDVANKYIPLPENVLGVVDIFDLSSTLLGATPFNATYQFVLNNVWDWQSSSLVPYFMAFQNMQLIEQVLIGKAPIRYNRYLNRLYIDADWNRLPEGTFIVARAYEVVDPDQYTKVWSDQWLTRYAAAQAKQQWGQNLKKFNGAVLPGGMQINGQALFDEATAEIKELDDELINSYSLPVWDMIG